MNEKQVEHSPREGLIDIKPIEPSHIEIPTTTLSILVALFVFFFLFVKKKTSPQLRTEENEKEAEINWELQAKEAIRSLKSENSNIKEEAFKLSQAIKSITSDTFGISIESCTAQEVRSKVASLSDAPDISDLLARIIKETENLQFRSQAPSDNLTGLVEASIRYLQLIRSWRSKEEERVA